MSTTTTQTPAQTREQRDAELYLAYMLAGKNATAAAKASGVARSSLQDAVKRHTARLDTAETVTPVAPTETPDTTADEAPATPATPAEDTAGDTETSSDEAPAKPAKKSRKAKGTSDKPAVNNLPYGVVTPVAFRHQMVQEGHAPESLRTQTIYDYVKHTRSNGFPVKHYPLTGEMNVYDEPQRDESGKATTRPGVLLAEGRDWLVAKTERDAAKAAA